MTKGQRRALKVAVAVIVLMLLFPPFNMTGEKLAFRAMTYGFLFDPPIFSRVDVLLLLAQWIAVGLVAGVCYVLLSDK